MGEFYGKKILRQETNSKTGEPWTLKDVPSLWRKRTQTWLSEHENND